MTTPESVLLTQIPIALGIFWLAWELRRLRRSLDRHLDDDRADGPGPDENAGADEAGR